MSLYLSLYWLLSSLRRLLHPGDEGTMILTERQ
jgi:hypothetical protein